MVGSHKSKIRLIRRSRRMCKLGTPLNHPDVHALLPIRPADHAKLRHPAKFVRIKGKTRQDILVEDLHPQQHCGRDPLEWYVANDSFFVCSADFGKGFTSGLS